jgi:hypothetical protein
VPPYSDTLARKEHFLGLLRQLEYQQKAGNLVSMETAKSVLFEGARALRNTWLVWPAKVGALIAADLGVEADRVTDVLTGYVHKQVASLGAPDPSRFDESTE